MQGIFQGESKMAEIIRGKGVISGIAMGKIMLAGQNLDGYLVNYKPEDKATEKQKAQDALTAVAEILRESIEKLKSKDMKEQAAIMEAHRMMVQDPMMADNIMAKIEELGNAPQGVLKAAEEQAVMFEQMEDEYFAARAVDLRDVGKRVAKYILGVKEPEVGDEKVILCGREIEPSVIAGMETEKIAGVLLGSGSTTAHAVIIAKARAIPTIVGLNKEDRIDRIADGDHVIMDGERGEIVINPAPEDIASYDEKIKKQKELAEHYAALKDLPAVTTDGVKVDLMANIGTHMDVDNALNYGAEGVGLFRSEFVFMGLRTSRRRKTSSRPTKRPSRSARASSASSARWISAVTSRCRTSTSRRRRIRSSVIAPSASACSAVTSSCRSSRPSCAPASTARQPS